MEMAAAPHVKKRRTSLPKRPHPPAPAAVVESHCRKVPPGAAGREGDGVDRISGLPDAVLGEIVSLLPTKDGIRTQALASRWRHLWLSAPLNIDRSSLPVNANAQLLIISRILAAHPGPARRLSVSLYFLFYRHETFEKWFGSAALNNLQELELGHGEVWYFENPVVSLPPSAFRFSATLRVATITKCVLDAMVETVQFPQLRQLELVDVKISGDSLHKMIAGCPVLESLQLKKIYGFSTIRISSHSLICFSFHISGYENDSKKLIVEDAPLLERLLQLETCRFLHVSIISAPKLETLGCLTDRDLNSELVLGTTVIQKLCAVSFMTGICCVKVLAVNVNSPKSMDALLDLMRCFPCLEKLYIQMSSVFGGKYVWRCNQPNQVKCLDSSLTTVVFKDYRGLKPHVKFATFFILNAKRLEVMRFEARGLKFYNNKKFIAEQRKLHQLFEKRASRAGQFYFTGSRCERDLPHIKHVNDLSKTNPFECTCLAWLS
ncbi:hypothetical protein EJB05_56253 [Eragrostis curvula]|uniref:Uncharacterized protein n=1 Tax=Eragrostis curvula TaxID=38414 RepID=A0A5J9SIS3_9POAL|nr:hypothetical protein EJB05_56253 [Eragrostis curvula]